MLVEHSLIISFAEDAPLCRAEVKLERSDFYFLSLSSYSTKVFSQSCLAVPKSASTRCHWSLKRMLPGFRSLWMILLVLRKAKMLMS